MKTKTGSKTGDAVVKVPRFRLFLMVAVVGAAYFLSNFHRLSFGVMGGLVVKDFSLSAGQLGTLGFALFCAYAIMQLFCGVAADKLQTRTLIVLSCLLTGCGTLWFSQAWTFASLVGSRSLTGAAIACVYVPALASFRRWFGDESFGTVTGVLVAIGQLGSLSASTPLKLAIDAMSWREVFALLGCVSLLLAGAAFFCVLKNPERPLRQKEAFAGDLWVPLLNPAFLVVTVWFFITGGTRVAFQGLWGADFFVRALGKGADQSSLFLMWQSVGCILGALFLGYVSDVLGSMRTLTLSGTTLTVTWVALGLSGPNTPGWVVGALNLLLGAVGTGGLAVAFGSIRLFSEGANTGFLSGVNNCSTFLGSALAAQGTGYFVQTLETWPIAEKYSVLWLFFAALCFISTLSVAWANRSHLKAGL
ncbi:MAG: MFS transporter [Synergistaceae bacterium]|jgi:sugar phosphate permease|nr:MFS transporter [Synergistaceae bacterium]